MITGFEIYKNNYQNNQISILRDYFIKFFKKINIGVEQHNVEIYIISYVYKGDTYIDVMKKDDNIYIDIVDADFIKSDFENWVKGELTSKFLIDNFNKLMKKLGHIHWALRSYEFPIKYIPSLITMLKENEDDLLTQLELIKYNI